jgi:hypothetical protein
MFDGNFVQVQEMPKKWTFHRPPTKNSLPVLFLFEQTVNACNCLVSCFRYEWGHSEFSE